MMKQFILALDQGTTSSRAILFDQKGQIVSVAQKEFTQIFPQPGWVEHDPQEIWSTQAGVAAEATVKAGANGTNIAAMGITNQRETVVVWNRKTGTPVYNAIVWQDRRTAEYCNEIKLSGKDTMIREKTGLIIDSYFSATKIKWILDHVPDARRQAEAGELICGTIDTWLIWNFTRGELHVTDVTNASRTMLFNINSMEWDEELLTLFNIPKSMLPEVKQSSEVYGETKSTIFASAIPIAGIAGDQQAALFGQMCTSPGMVKNTYGTGCFMLMNIGDTPRLSKNNLLTTVAWKVNGKTQYALEGSIFIAGAVVQWLRDGLGIIKTSAEVEALALKVKDTEGVYFVPAFAGLGAPYWDSDARGTLVGMTRGTTAAHIAVRNTTSNVISEMIGTFALVFTVFYITGAEITTSKMAIGLGSVGALPVAFLVWAIGLSLGGTTGYAINPARDLGPRLMHAILPIPTKGSSDWGYSWIPVIGPILGGAAAAFLYLLLQK
jgi:glycerol kinase